MSDHSEHVIWDGGGGLTDRMNLEQGSPPYVHSHYCLHAAAMITDWGGKQAINSRVPLIYKAPVQLRIYFILS